MIVRDVVRAAAVEFAWKKLLAGGR